MVLVLCPVSSALCRESERVRECEESRRDDVGGSLREAENVMRELRTSNLFFHSQWTGRRQTLLNYEGRIQDT